MINSADEAFISLLHQIADIEDVEFSELAEQLTRVWGYEPISDRMAPRYRRAVNAYSTCSRLSDFMAIPIDVRGDMKGIFSRVAKRDQWDWMNVQIGLRLKRNECFSISRLLNQLKFAQNDSERESIYAKLEQFNVQKSLESLLDYIEKHHQGLSKPKHFTKRSPIGVPEELTNIIDYGPILAKIFTAGKIHEKTEMALVKFLRSAGFRCEQNLYVDVFSRLKSGPAMFEVKSINDQNERSQTRKAVAQLLEYRFLHAFDNPTLWIVFSRQPSDLKICAEFPKSLDIKILWLASESLTGPNYHELLSAPRPNF
jgi:hypothetical protein